MKQFFSWWCSNAIPAKELFAGAAKIGYAGIELLEEMHWPMATDFGLKLATICGHGTLENGLNRRENAARIDSEIRANLEKAHRWNIPVLICFSGNRAGISDAAGLEICAETLARVAPEAEAAGVILAVELLNSKINHIDYQADHTEWGVALTERVGSKAVKLLYDIYHMQIMEGDLIRTIQKHHAHIGHYHTAGNPGRGPMDDNQEIHYPPIYRAIAATGYTGWIGHEFAPKGPVLDELKTAYDQVVNALAK
jgi:hydroxypyruvate isomerase